MFDVISKKEYFAWWEEKIADRKDQTLKGIQDAWVMSLFQDRENLKIAEIGGGNSRVLNHFKQKNECWNIDKFEGFGGGPTKIADMSNIKVVHSYMGDFDSNIPSDYFDLVFSISVVEHVPTINIPKFFADCNRILKPGGIMAHAIDAYVTDIPIVQRLGIIKEYIKAVENEGFEWSESPKIDQNLIFKSYFASNSDVTMAIWNHVAPSLKEIREEYQSVSLKLMAYKK